MFSLEGFIENTNAETTADGVFSQFLNIIQTYGYDRICYSLITDHPSVNIEAGHGIMKNYPESWMEHYQKSNYAKLDPVPQFCFQTNRPFTWDFVTKHIHISDIQMQIMQEANEEKLYSGIAVPIHGLNGELSGVGLASSYSKSSHDNNALMKINAICRQFHLAYTELMQSEKQTSKIKLTNREREVLLWAAEGKSDSIIADILGISHATVRFHLGNIYTKLETNERIFAVMKAIRLGLILPNYIQTTPYQT